MIGGWLKSKFMAPFTFQGGCNTIVFNTRIDQVLLQTIIKGITTIIYNAAFHKSAKTREMIEAAGLILLILIPWNTVGILCNHASGHLFKIPKLPSNIS